jgi:carbon-monoxide dehydrogenase iron sulfur subunit
MNKNGHKFLFVNPEKCLGCSLCEYACSLKKTEEFNPIKSRIRVVRIHPFVNVALVCKMCDDPPCVNACPTESLSQSKETGVIFVDKEKCNGCHWCIEACPYGAIQYDEDTSAVTICDLCDGKPECMDICPTEAIDFSTSDEDVKTKWVGARKSWTEESKKFMRIVEGEKIDIFSDSNKNMEKIEEKLELLYQKKMQINKTKKL